MFVNCRAAKYRNGQLAEAYERLDFLRPDGYRHGERTPFAMRRDDGAEAYLFYDQVGSLRVVADGDGDVIKEVLYDPFGGIIEDTNPGCASPSALPEGCTTRTWASCGSAGEIMTRSPVAGPRPTRWATRAATRIGMGIVWMIRSTGWTRWGCLILIVR